MEDTVDRFDAPRTFREELSRLLNEDLSLRSMWDELDRLMVDFTSPPGLRQQLSRIFDDVGMGRDMFVPQLDLDERDKEYVLRVDLPGVKEQDIDLRVDGDFLTVSGRRRRVETTRERGFAYVERTFGSFSRSIELPRSAETTRIETDFRDGVLEVRIPKNEAARARHIPIGARAGQRAGSAAEEPRVLPPSGDGPRRESRENDIPREEQRR